MTYTTSPGILESSSLTAQCLEKFKTPQRWAEMYLSTHKLSSVTACYWCLCRAGS